MNKGVIVIAVGIVLLFVAILTPYKTPDGFTRKGLPLGYYKTIDTDGLCIGFMDEKQSDATNVACGKRNFPLKYDHLVEDLVVVGIVAGALVYLSDRKKT